VTERRTEQWRGTSPLQTERGNTSISDTVISKIAGIAAQEVEGIRMGSGASQAVGGIVGPITGGQTQGVSVEVGQEEAALDLTLTAEYGKSIPPLAEAVRRNVIKRVENLVGLRVTEVNIAVSNVFFPQQEERLAGPGRPPGSPIGPEPKYDRPSGSSTGPEPKYGQQYQA
jgi:uncharacterized alkaline shock family protein YloU